MSVSSHFEFRSGSWREVQGRHNSGSVPARATSLSDERRIAILRGAERDGFTLPGPEFQFPVLAGILRFALGNSNGINVLDFGGSVGSVYFQLKSFCGHLKSFCGLRIRWNVVEVPEKVQIGRENFENDELHFYYGIDECLRETRPTIILLSGVLQYLEEPVCILRMCGEIGARTLIIDRTTCSDSPDNMLAVQVVNDSSTDLYAEYPLWILSAPRLMRELSNHWELLSSFDSVVDSMSAVDHISIKYRGFLFDSKDFTTDKLS